MYCLAGASLFGNNDSLESYLFPVKEIVKASINAETDPVKAVMAMYKTMDSLGLAEDKLHDMNSPVEEEPKQGEGENFDMTYSADNDDGGEQIEEQYNGEHQYVDNYNNDNNNYNEEQNENEANIEGYEEGGGEEGDGEEQYEEGDGEEQYEEDDDK